MLRLCTALLLQGALVHGHGFVEVPECRAHMCRSQGGANKDCGPVQYEAQSVEGPDRYPDSNPADGKLASGGSRFTTLDEQTSTRWEKNPASSGPWKVTWNFQANHASLDFRYFITKDGWNQNAPLTRATFESTPFCTIERGGALPPMKDTHDCVLPQKSGYHIVYAIWDVYDTSNSFYNVIDMQFSGGSNPMPSPPVVMPPRAPVPAPWVQPPPAPTPWVPPPPAPQAPTGCSPVIGRWGGCSNAQNCCAAGNTCKVINRWFAQCVPGASPPAPAPWSAPAPAPWSAPAPQGGSGCSSTVSRWGSCTSNPSCCTSGCKCYEQNKYFAQCLKDTDYHGNWKVIGGSGSAPATPPYAPPPPPPATPPTYVSPPVWSPPVYPPVYPPPAVPTPVMTPPSGGGRGNIVSLDFESESLNTIPAGWGTFTSWQANVGSATSVVHVDSTRAHSGSKSLKVKGPSGDPAQIVKRLDGNPKNVYFRAYFWLTKTMGNQPGDNHEQIMGTKKYYSASRPFSGDAELRVGQAKGHLGFNQVPTDAVSPPLAKWFTGPQIPKGTWSCVEAAVLTDKPFHEMYMWVDDKLVNSVTSAADWHANVPNNWAEGLIDNVYFGWHSFSQRGMDLWIDDIEVSTGRIGC